MRVTLLLTIYREKRLDLVPLVQSPGPDWKFDFDRENLWRLPGAHGEEVVRSVYLDEQVGFNMHIPYPNTTGFHG